MHSCIVCKTLKFTDMRACLCHNSCTITAVQKYAILNVWVTFRFWGIFYAFKLVLKSDVDTLSDDAICCVLRINNQRGMVPVMILFFWQRKETGATVRTVDMLCL